MRPLASSRTRWAYSTAGFDVLGALSSVSRGMRFDRFLKNNCSKSAGMKDTSFWIQPIGRSVGAQLPVGGGRIKVARNHNLVHVRYDVEDRGRTVGARWRRPFLDGGRYGALLPDGGTRRAEWPADTETGNRRRDDPQVQTGDLSRGPECRGDWDSLRGKSRGDGSPQVLSPGSFGHGGAYTAHKLGRPGQGPDMDRDVSSGMEKGIRQLRRANRFSGRRCLTCIDDVRDLAPTGDLRALDCLFFSCRPRCPRAQRRHV